MGGGWTPSVHLQLRTATSRPVYRADHRAASCPAACRPRPVSAPAAMVGTADPGERHPAARWEAAAAGRRQASRHRRAATAALPGRLRATPHGLRRRRADRSGASRVDKAFVDFQNDVRWRDIGTWRTGRATSLSSTSSATPPWAWAPTRARHSDLNALWPWPRGAAGAWPGRGAATTFRPPYTPRHHRHPGRAQRARHLALGAPHRPCTTGT